MTRGWIVAAAVAAACVPGMACGGSSGAPSASVAGAGSPAPLATRLAAADAALQASLRRWQTTDPSLRDPAPAGALSAAATERDIVHQLSEHPTLARRTLAALPSSLRPVLGADIMAARDLWRLAGSPTTSTGTRLHLVPPAAAGELLADYRRAERRFGTQWQVLAAVNLVESAFGRVTNRSSAGAQGPMQFLPATWRAYGLGGNIHAPRDAILGAANYLHQSGAPGDDRRAMYAYNHSDLYVAAVLAYARQMTRDPLGYLTYYAWEASLPATPGG